jgi:hypothetical protein
MIKLIKVMGLASVVFLGGCYVAAGPTWDSPFYSSGYYYPYYGSHGNVTYYDRETKVVKVKGWGYHHPHH